MLMFGIFLLFVSSSLAQGPGYDSEENSILPEGNGGPFEGIDFQGIENLFSGLFGNDSLANGLPGNISLPFPGTGGPDMQEINELLTGLFGNDSMDFGAPDYETNMPPFNRTDIVMPPGSFPNLGDEMSKLFDLAAKLASNMGDKIEDMAENLMDRMSPDIDMAMNMEILPEFRIPPYMPPLNPGEQFYEKIDFDSVRTTLQPAIEEAIQSGVPPTELLKTVKARIYAVKAKCTITLMKRLISAGLTKWANNAIMEIGSRFANKTSPTESSQPNEVFPVLGLVKRIVVGEINRTIFGEEFEEFESVVNFIQSSVTWGLMSNSTLPANVSVPEAVFFMTNFLLQCEDRQTFIQKLIFRIATLKRRILYANPWTLTLQVLRRMPMPCDLANPMPSGRELPVMRIFKITRFALRIIRRQLGKMLCCVESAIIYGDDSAIVDLFPKLLNNQTGVLRELLNRIRNSDGPNPFLPEPMPPHQKRKGPKPGSGNPDGNSPPGGNKRPTGTPQQTGTKPATGTPPTGTKPATGTPPPTGTKSPTGTMPPTGTPPPTTPPTNPPAKRAENGISKTKLLKLLLRGLLEEESDR